MYAIIWSSIVQKQVIGGRVAETETPFTPLQNTVLSEYWHCYFKVKKLYIVALRKPVQLLWLI